MRAFQLIEGAEYLTDSERLKWAAFIHYWLIGGYIGNKKNSATLWEKFAKTFPPKAKTMPLYRLVTVPIQFAEQKMINFRPAPGAVGSWTTSLRGIEYVAGLAVEQTEDGNLHKTARVAIKATISGDAILATPVSIRDAFVKMTEGWYEKYGEGDIPEPVRDKWNFYIDDVEYLRSTLKQRGGYQRQSEVIVRTPPAIKAEIVALYRVGDDVRREGKVA